MTPAQLIQENLTKYINLVNEARVCEDHAQKEIIKELNRIGLPFEDHTKFSPRFPPAMFHCEEPSTDRITIHCCIGAYGGRLCSFYLMFTDTGIQVHGFGVYYAKNFDGRWVELIKPDLRGSACQVSYYKKVYPGLGSVTPSESRCHNYDCNCTLDDLGPLLTALLYYPNYSS